MTSGGDSVLRRPWEGDERQSSYSDHMNRGTDPG